MQTHFSFNIHLYALVYRKILFLNDKFMFIIKNAQSITYRDKNIAFVLMLKIILSIFYCSCEKNRHIYIRQQVRTIVRQFKVFEEYNMSIYQTCSKYIIKNIKPSRLFQLFHSLNSFHSYSIPGVKIRHRCTEKARNEPIR